jgi:peptidoglycan lytic transglycosylase G
VEERPSRVTRHGSSSPAARGLAAIGGLILGVGVLAALAFAIVGRDDGQSTPTNAPTTTGPPPKPVLRIIFPEGFTIDDMAKRIRAVNKIAEEKRQITPKLEPRQYLRIGKAKSAPPQGFEYKKRVTSLEGFLFPATYDFTEDTTTRQLVDKQLEAFIRAWSQLDLRYSKSKNLTAYDVLIIASMVEKEVQVPKERSLVAAVIYNRLHAGLSLGIDATIRYGLHIPPTEPIHQSELDSDSPYNTRKFAGLTPTPIANPGLASLQAAAHPAKVDYLYFVRKADCQSHFFTASEKKFNNYPRAGLNC